MSVQSTPTAPSEAPVWYDQPAAEVLSRLGTATTGLSAAEVTRRLKTDGPNILKEAPRIGPLTMFLGQFKNFMIWILMAAGAVAGAFGETLDAIAILAIVILNAVIGFYQERKAEQAIAALKKMTAPRATVRRNGAVVAIPTADVVVGDILVLEAGDLVAADARILQATAFQCVEAALTGESEAVRKRVDALTGPAVALGDRYNMVFLGTSVAAGTGEAVVVATGMATELGRIAGLMESADAGETTPLQQNLNAFGRVLVWVTLSIVALLFGLGFLQGIDSYELFLTSASLAVAAVPEGLPAIVTVALALGVLRMSRRRALVRKLHAVETLGSTSVICTDKTGTLTVGEMTVRALYVAEQRYEVTGQGYAPEGEIRIGAQRVHHASSPSLQMLATALISCNHAHLTVEEGNWKVVGDPTEGALLVVASKAGGDRELLEHDTPTVTQLPFDSDRKLSTVIRRLTDGSLRGFTLGAPDLLLARCTAVYTATGVRSMTPADRDRILTVNSAMAQDALRVLGSAYRDWGANLPGELTPAVAECDMVFVGLSGMFDPPRAEAHAAVTQCRAAGIKVVMITGDHPQTAAAIGRKLGIAADAGDTATGVDLDRMSDADLQSRAPKIAIYARVTAEHKLRIVKAWQANGAVVAMTGDGVNDAPAIKGADIGIAMGQGGTEVTRQASDMIVTDDNFASIVAAVEEGRGIYDNIRKTLQYLLAGNAGELLLMTLCMSLGLAAPLVPIHLLWINLVTDGLPALCLATDPIDPDVMKRRPRRRSERIADRRFLGTLALTGCLTGGIAFLVFYQGVHENVAAARSQAFAVLVFAELLRAFGGRSNAKPVWRISLFSNLSLLAVVLISFALQVVIHNQAGMARIFQVQDLSFIACLQGLALGAIPLIVLEGVKVLTAWRRGTNAADSELPAISHSPNGTAPDPDSHP